MCPEGTLTLAAYLEVRYPRAEGEKSGQAYRFERTTPLQLLRKVATPGEEVDRRGAHGRSDVRSREPAEAEGDLLRPPGVRRWAGAGEAHAVGRRLQPLQARPDDAVGRRAGPRAPEVQHPAARPDRLRQDAARPNAREDPERAVRDRGRHRANRGRVRR